MNNCELESILKDVPVTVCCANELPSRIKKRPHYFVTNTDNCDKPGTHWVVFYFPSKGSCEFFDSLGQTPERYHARFKNILVTNGSSYIFTLDAIQPMNSITCGLYCIYFVKNRYRNISFSNILSFFSTKALEMNDRKMNEYLNLTNVV